MGYLLVIKVEELSSWLLWKEGSYPLSLMLYPERYRRKMHACIHCCSCGLTRASPAMPCTGKAPCTFYILTLVLWEKSGGAPGVVPDPYVHQGSLLPLQVHGR